MAKFNLTLILALTFLLCPLAAVSLHAQSQIVAVINNDIITQKDLDDFVHFMRLQMGKESKGAALESKIEALKKDLLSKLIDDRLIIQEAKKSKMTVGPAKIKERIGEIKKQYGSELVFQQELAKQGLVQADIENKIRDQIMMYGIVEVKVRNQVTIRPSEVTDFYNNNLGKFMTAEGRKVDLILISDENSTLNAVYGDLKKGVPTAELALRYPIEVTDLTVTNTGEFKKEIVDAVFALDIGEASRPVVIDGKHYIFKLNEIIPPRQASLSEVKNNVHSFLMENKMREDLAKWLDELKKQSYIKIY